jgi:hypothetical protein
VFIYFSLYTYLIDFSYYNSYMDFFIAELERKSLSAVVEEYNFSDKANFIPGDGKQPQMLVRFLDSILHPVSCISCECYDITDAYIFRSFMSALAASSI